MSDNQIDSDKRHPGSLANFIKRNLVLFITLLGVISSIFLLEYYPMILAAGSQVFIFCEKCWSIFNEII